MRTAQVDRKTSETDISLFLSIDGGQIEVSTGIGFLDHMLRSFALHAGFGLNIKCVGDLEIDAHHTAEDCGIVLGKAFFQALGDKSGIARYGSIFIPMDESLDFVNGDISG
ncbi:MAG: imidazoleglycerol-phosphate dehydratase, partial [Clostridiales bacterium]|nr:imidazoleglycerol-phosphate dehydratase [Clostridiales bacterium]